MEMQLGGIVDIRCISRSPTKPARRSFLRDVARRMLHKSRRHSKPPDRFTFRHHIAQILCGVLNSASWLLLAWLPPSRLAIAALILLGSAATACSDVVADSIVVELCRGEPQSRAGSLQSLCWGCSALGSVGSAYFSGSLVGSSGTRLVFALTGFFPLLTVVAGVLAQKERGPPVPAGSPGSRASGPAMRLLMEQQARELWAALRHPAIYLPTCFLFCWQATPSIDNVMTYFQTEALGFDPEMLGRIRLVGALASLAGVGLYNFALRATPLRRIFLWGGLLAAGLGLTQLILVTGTLKAAVRKLLRVHQQSTACSVQPCPNPTYPPYTTSRP